MQQFMRFSVVLLLAGRLASHAEEGGSSHYLPGQFASFIDAFPGRPGAIVPVNYFTYYDADAGGDRTLPLGGLLTAGVDATVHANSLGALYQTPWEVLGGGLAFGAVIPYVWVEVEGQARRLQPDGTPGPVFDARDTANGIGDIMLIPYMLGWTNILPDLKLDTRLMIYAPTGEFEPGRLANAGKNYWSFEPGIMASWLSSKIGTEASFYAGMGFNTENPDTDYQSGNSLHLELTLAQHLPLLGGILGVGANGFHYEQVSGDSGDGAVLGDFKGRTTGIGPVLSYARKVGRADLVAEVKWLPELNVERRLEGDYVWFKLALLF